MTPINCGQSANDQHANGTVRQIEWRMPRPDGPSPLKAIVAGGVLAALLDLIDPVLFFHFRNGIAPIRVPQSIASGLVGRAAFTGGTRTALLGLGLHLLIAMVWASAFVFSARVIPFLTWHPIRSGLLYGAIVYLVMNYAVLPLSRVALSRPTLLVVINGVLAMLLLVGLPISLANRRFAPYPHT